MVEWSCVGGGSVYSVGRWAACVVDWTLMDDVRLRRSTAPGHQCQLSATTATRRRHQHMLDIRRFESLEWTRVEFVSAEEADEITVPGSLDTLRPPTLF